MLEDNYQQRMKEVKSKGPLSCSMRLSVSARVYCLADNLLCTDWRMQAQCPDDNAGWQAAATGPAQVIMRVLCRTRLAASSAAHTTKVLLLRSCEFFESATMATLTGCRPQCRSERV